MLYEVITKALLELAKIGEAAGLEVTTHTSHERPVADAVISRAMDVDPMFVVKGTHYHSPAERATFAVITSYSIHYTKLYDEEAHRGIAQQELKIAVHELCQPGGSSDNVFRIVVEFDDCQNSLAHSILPRIQYRSSTQPPPIRG